MLPLIRLAYLRSQPSFTAIVQKYASSLLGRLYILPAELGDEELGIVVDALVALTGLQVKLYDSSSEKQPRLYLYSGDPVVFPDLESHSIIVTSQNHIVSSSLEKWSLEIPHVLLTINQALVDVFGMSLRDQPLGRLAPWSLATLIGDTPATWLAAANAMAARFMRQPDCNVGDMLESGLVAALRHLLREIDWRIIEWVLALASGAPGAESWLSVAASQLSRSEAMRRAFAVGLVQHIEQPEQLDVFEEVPRIAWRRPIALLSKLQEAPGQCTLVQIVEALRPHLPIELAGFVYRLTQPRNRDPLTPLPGLPQPLLRRAALLDQLMTLTEPATTVRTTILYGSSGYGKTTLATELARQSAFRCTPVWVSFAAGPILGWLPVAEALGIHPGDSPELSSYSSDLSGPVPIWIQKTLSTLSIQPYLVIVERVDRGYANLAGVPSDALAAWLPSGHGPCAVLVLSEDPLIALQRKCDAIAVQVPALTLAEARELAAITWVAGADRLRQGEFDDILRAADRRPFDVRLLFWCIRDRGELKAVEIIQQIRSQQKIRNQKIKAHEDISDFYVNLLLFYSDISEMVEFLHMIGPSFQEIPATVLAILPFQSDQDYLSNLRRSKILQERGGLIRVHPLLQAPRGESRKVAQLCRGFLLAAADSKKARVLHRQILSGLVGLVQILPRWSEVDPEAAVALIEQLQTIDVGIRRLNLLTTVEACRALLTGKLTPEIRKQLEVRRRYALSRILGAGRPLTRYELRKVLRELLRTTEDLEGFIIDHFPHVVKHITEHMDRIALENLFLSEIDVSALLAVLHNEFPTQLAIPVSSLYDRTTKEDPAILTPEVEQRQRVPADQAAYFLRRVLSLSSDFDAFCIDYFSETHRMFTPGMDMVVRQELLFEREGPETVLRQLQSAYPERFQRAQERRSRALVPTAASLRRVLARLCPERDMLLAFVTDEFPEFAYWHIAQAADRTRIVNSLLRYVDPDDLIDALRRRFPDEWPEVQGMVVYGPDLDAEMLREGAAVAPTP